VVVFFVVTKKYDTSALNNKLTQQTGVGRFGEEH